MSDGEDVEKLKASYIAGRNIKSCSHFRKVWQFLKWLNIQLPYDLAFPFLFTYPREMETYAHTNLYMNVHTSI